MTRLLIVDDDPRILDGIENLLFLHAPKWEAVRAEGGEEAEGLLATQPFDVLLTDMRMPGVDGPAVLRTALHLQPGAIRIALTGQVERDTAAGAIPLVHQFLTKPCPSAKLIETLEWAMGRYADSTPYEQAAVGAITMVPCTPETSAAVVAQVLAGVERRDIAELVRHDLGLTISVLRWANSGFFDVAPAATVADAVAVLSEDWLLVALSAPVMPMGPALAHRMAEVNARLRDLAPDASEAGTAAVLGELAESLPVLIDTVDGAAPVTPVDVIDWRRAGATLLDGWRIPLLAPSTELRPADHYPSDHRPCDCSAPAASPTNEVHA